MNEHIKPDAITRASTMAGWLREFRDGINADLATLDELIEAFHAQESHPEAQAATERQITALLRAILDDLISMPRRD